MVYNFLNDVELYWGLYFLEYMLMIILFFNEIFRLDYLLFIMSIKKIYYIEGYDRVFDYVVKGGWFMMVKVIYEGFVFQVEIFYFVKWIGGFFLGLMKFGCIFFFFLGLCKVVYRLIWRVVFVRVFRILREFDRVVLDYG